VEEMGNGKSPPNETLYRLLICVGVSLAIMAATFSMIERIRTNRELAAIDAPGFVRAVRQNENWIHDVNSLLIRVNSGEICSNRFLDFVRPWRTPLGMTPLSVFNRAKL